MFKITPAFYLLLKLRVARLVLRLQWIAHNYPVDLFMLGLCRLLRLSRNGLLYFMNRLKRFYLLLQLKRPAYQTALYFPRLPFHNWCLLPSGYSVLHKLKPFIFPTRHCLQEDFLGPIMSTYNRLLKWLLCFVHEWAYANALKLFFILANRVTKKLSTSSNIGRSISQKRTDDRR